MKKITLLISAIFLSGLINGQCNEPSNIQLSNAGYYNIFWNANGESFWDIEYNEQGFTPTGIPTIDDLSSSWLDLVDIPNSMYYDLYIRADCGSATSDWVGPFTFYNYCTEFCVDESFESNILPQCWAESSEGSPTTGLGIINTSLWEVDTFANSYTNSAKININGNEINEWLIMPLVMGGTPDIFLFIEFDVALTENASTLSSFLGSDDEVALVYSNDLGDTWSTIYTWDSNSTISNTGETKTIITYIDGIDTYKFLLAFWASSGINIDDENVDFFIDNVEACFTIGINETLIEKGFSFYPNPSNNTINLNAKEKINSVIFYNQLGQEVKKANIDTINSQLDISDLPNAIYFMKVQIGNTVGVVSVIKE